MFKLLISYPDKKQESEIIQRFTTGVAPHPAKILSTDEMIAMQDFVREIYVDDTIYDYITEIVDATRFPANYNLDISNHIEYGASPRASIWLTISAKASALLHGRGYVTPQDVQNIAHDVLRHRILLTYEAEAEQVTTDEIIQKILEKIKVP